VLFYIFDCLLTDKSRFSAFSSSALATNVASFDAVVKKSMPSTHTALSRLGALEETYLKEVFINTFQHLFLPEAVDEVLDIFLLQGTKALFQFALGIIVNYKKQIKKQAFKTAGDFWAKVKSDRVNLDEFARIKRYALEVELPVKANPFSVRYSLVTQSLASITGSYSTDTAEVNAMHSQDLKGGVIVLQEEVKGEVVALPDEVKGGVVALPEEAKGGAIALPDEAYEGVEAPSDDQNNGGVIALQAEVVKGGVVATNDDEDKGGVIFSKLESDEGEVATTRLLLDTSASASDIDQIKSTSKNKSVVEVQPEDGAAAKWAAPVVATRKCRCC
jgi:hypothetical protein